MAVTVFWSWQGDLKQDICRNLIKSAIEGACHKISQSSNLVESERPEIDHDTKDKPGMAAIVDSIFEKIDNAAVFIGDLTPIAKSESGKEVANPNVLIEMGYAFKSLGPERLIAVVNSAFGAKAPEKLPFNIRHRRGAIYYKLGKNAGTDDIKRVKDSLADELAKYLVPCLQHAREVKEAKTPSIQRNGYSGDLALWFEPSRGLTHQHFAGGNLIKVQVPKEGPRSYMRIIPSSWTSDLPARSTVHSSREQAPLWPLGTNWRAGDGGVNSDGVLEYGFSGQDNDQRVVWTCTQWFKDSGELWGIDWSVGQRTDTGTAILSPRYILGCWKNYLDQGLKFMKHYGAGEKITVEAGISGLQGTHWSMGAMGIGNAAVDDHAMFAHTTETWSAEIRLIFLCNLYNRLLDAFGIGPISSNQIERMINS